MEGGDQEGVLTILLLWGAEREVRALVALATALLHAARSALFKVDGGGVGRLDAAAVAMSGSERERFCPGSTLAGVAGEAAGGAPAPCLWKKLVKPICLDIARDQILFAARRSSCTPRIETVAGLVLCVSPLLVFL
eukprot:scaffold24398_cov133-Isochrysis_galbana.AAC.12